MEANETQPSGCVEVDVREPIRRQVLLPASPDAVWAALTTSRDLAAWFGAEVQLDPRPGGAVDALWPDGRRCRGMVEVVDPVRRLAFRWRRIRAGAIGFTAGEASRVEFVLEAAPGGTRLTLTEEPWPSAGTDARVTAVVTA